MSGAKCTGGEELGVVATQVLWSFKIIEDPTRHTPHRGIVPSLRGKALFAPPEQRSHGPKNS